MATEVVLQQLVEQNLSLFLYENAKFYAERLYYERKTQGNLHILAQCYFRQGKTKQAYLVLQGHHNSAENRYLLAQCCLALDKLDEGERTLLASVPKEGVSLISVIPGGAAGLYLLGLICKRGHRRESAIRYFKLSLEADRTNWGAILQLSDLGEAIDITKIYGLSVPEAIEALQSSDRIDEADLSRGYRNDEGGGNDGDAGKGPGGKQQSLFGKTYFEVAGAGAAGGDGTVDMDANDENISNQTSDHVHLDRSVLNTSQARLGGDSALMAATGADATRMSRGGAMFDDEVGGEEQTTLRDRQLAESTSGIAFNSPNVSMSLGMSSSSLNIPFASPGSVPRNDFLHYLRGTNRIVPSAASAGGMHPHPHQHEHSVNINMNVTSYSAHSGPGGESGTDALAAIRGGRDSSIHSHSGMDMGASGTGAAAGQGSRANTGGNSSTLSEFGGNANQTRTLFDMSSPVTPIGHESSHMHINASGGLGLGLGTGLTSITEGGFHHRHDLDRARSYGLSHTGSGDAEDDHHADVSILAGQTPSNNSEALPPRSGDSTGTGTGTGRGRGGLGSTVSTTRGTHTGGRPNRDSLGLGAPRNVARRVSFGAGEGEGDFPAVSPATASGTGIETGAGAGAGMAARSSQSSEVSPYPTRVTGTGTGAGADARIGLPDAEPLSTKMPRLDGTAGSSDGPQMDYAPHMGYSGDNMYDHDGNNNNNTTPAHGPHYLAALLTVLSASYQLAGLYRCRDCIALVHHLPPRHLQSAWVQHLLGRAYSECNDYRPSLLALKEMLRLEPFRLQGVELLSTVLWQLKKDKDLCALAQQVSEVDKLAPEVWCVVGNCFSLQREPEAAIKFFRRATQVDPHYAYAYTLSGHEAAHNEDFELATSYFRKALLCDDRHYSAWYGLGSVYYHQERFGLAEYHFRRALSINKASSVLHCYLGMVLRAQGSEAKVNEALQVLSRACEAYPANSQLRFQRAQALIYLEDWCGAVQELEVVRELAPREAAVYSLLGSIFQDHTHQVGEALTCFNMAIALDPKEGTALRPNLERISNPGTEAEFDEGEGGDSFGSQSQSQGMLSGAEEEYDEDEDVDETRLLDDFSPSM